ncbi:sensor histidine kinase [Sediminibacillus massiliensis]|uniref:sensor histidine kinase n=1 Tax=Sediminibacillus massiliensis TaxID=1926277 RepID=UPI000988742B|nr:HAMP domain-containing sensor histidine kinase [Sediminibacillus massiliensis]
MDTKWKNRIELLSWLVLFAYGFSGVITAWFDVHDYRNQNSLFWIYTVGAVFALIFGIILGKRNDFFTRIAPDKWLHLYKKIPLDLAIFVFLSTLFISLQIYTQNFFIYYYGLVEKMQGMIYHFVHITIWCGLSLVQGIYLFKRMRDYTSFQADLKRGLSARFLKAISDMFLNRRVGTQVFFSLAMLFCFGVGTGLVLVVPELIIILIPGFLLVKLPLLFLLVRRIGYFNRIVMATNAVANGDAEPDLKVKGKSVLAKLAEDINKMKHGFRTSQQAQAKSERLKTELITNVSHDLRTPLTSIMTYTELLKKPELSEEDRQSYVGIIDRKSQRLKVLIDDLFEASKMASGNMELTKDKVDIVQLLQQALAEYNEAIQESSLQFRVLKPDEPVYALVDGQKLWRVFENLIGNMLKYSLPNTRAFIIIKREQGRVIITFKNISEYELSENIDELFERFKRGDESRHTEGSGLGLAIAKSIIDLHGGILEIQVDGDLFKVTIELDNQRQDIST